MASGIDSIVLSNASASSAALPLMGGRYSIDAVATWNSGSVSLQRLAGDGSTYLDISGVYEKADGTGGTAVNHKLASLTANGLLVFDIPAGVYRITVSSATAVYARVSRVPL